MCWSGKRFVTALTKTMELTETIQLARGVLASVIGVGGGGTWVVVDGMVSCCRVHSSSQKLQTSVYISNKHKFKKLSYFCTGFGISSPYSTVSHPSSLRDRGVQQRDPVLEECTSWQGRKQGR